MQPASFKGQGVCMALQEPPCNTAPWGTGAPSLVAPLVTAGETRQFNEHPHTWRFQKYLFLPPVGLLCQTYGSKTAAILQSKI